MVERDVFLPIGVVRVGGVPPLGPWGGVWVWVWVCMGMRVLCMHVRLHVCACVKASVHIRACACVNIYVYMRVLNGTCCESPVVGVVHQRPPVPRHQAPLAVQRLSVHRDVVFLDLGAVQRLHTPGVANGGGNGRRWGVAVMGIHKLVALVEQVAMEKKGCEVHFCTKPTRVKF